MKTTTKTAPPAMSFRKRRLGRKEIGPTDPAVTVSGRALSVAGVSTLVPHREQNWLEGTSALPHRMQYAAAVAPDAGFRYLIARSPVCLSATPIPSPNVQRSVHPRPRSPVRRRTKPQSA